MDLRQLSALVAIADHGSFSAAARALFTVQSNVSGHIGKLERELGVTLIDRSAGRLTDEGERVLERARRILNELDDIASDIASLDSEVSGEARVGLIGTAAEWLAPGLMEEMSRRHPLVHTVLSEGSTSALVPNVLTSLLNAAVIHLPIEEPDLIAETLFSEELLLLVPRGHRMHRATGVTLSDLRETPLLLPPKGAALRRILDRAAANSGTMLRAAAEIDGVRLLTTLAVAGHGPAIVPATAARDLGEGIDRISVDDLPRRVVAWARRRRPNPSAATNAVHSALRAVVAAHAADQPGIHLEGGSDGRPSSTG